MKYIWLCLALTWATALQAQEDSSDSAGDSSRNLDGDLVRDLGDLAGDLPSDLLGDLTLEQERKPKSPLEIHGEHRLSLMLPFSSGLNTRATQPALRNQVHFGFDPGAGLALSGGVQLNSFLRASLEHELLLDETYLHLYSLQGLWSLYFGWQKISWGGSRPDWAHRCPKPQRLSPYASAPRKAGSPRGSLPAPIQAVV